MKLNDGNKSALLILGLFALLFFVLLINAKADIVTCADSTCAITTTKPKADLGTNEYVLFCESGTTRGAVKSACTKYYGYRFGGMQSGSWILSTDGWYPLSEVPVTITPPTFTYKKPPCVPWDVSVYYQNYSMTPFVGVWFCETPTGIIRSSWSGDARNILATCAKQSNSQDAFEVHRLANCRNKTPEEQAIADALAKSVTAKVINVTLSDGSIVGPLKYAKLADGTRNTKSAGRAAKDQARAINDRIINTSYYKLTGEEAYAQCTVTGKYVKMK